MTESLDDELILGPCNAVVHISNGISTMGCRIKTSIHSRSMILKDRNGQVLASFEIVIVTNETHLNFDAFYLVHGKDKVTAGTSFTNPILCFRRQSGHDSSTPKCLLKPLILWNDYLPEFVMEFDIGHERDLVSLTLLGLSHRKHQITVQVEKDLMGNYCIVGSRAIIDKAITVVRLEDRRYLPEFLWVLCSQLKKGRLREYDINNISRKRNPLLVPGYLGLRCIHCGGLENGNYFPTKRGHLYGCTMRFEKHLHTCRKCPFKIKQLVAKLKQLHKNHEHENSQKVKIHFFNELWDRIQNPDLEGDDFSIIEEILTNLESKHACISTTSSIENLKVSLVQSPALIKDLEGTVNGSLEVRKSGSQIATAEENLDPLTEYLTFANVGEISPSNEVLQNWDGTISSNTKIRTVALNNDTQFTWDHRSLIDLERFLQFNPDMMDCLDVLLL